MRDVADLDFFESYKDWTTDLTIDWGSIHSSKLFRPVVVGTFAIEQHWDKVEALLCHNYGAFGPISTYAGRVLVSVTLMSCGCDLSGVRITLNCSLAFQELEFLCEFALEATRKLINSKWMNRLGQQIARVSMLKTQTTEAMVTH